MSVCYRYDGSLDGFLTCVYESYVHHEEPAAFVLPEDGMTLWEEREIVTDLPNAKRVWEGLGQKTSPLFRAMIARGFLTCLPERELALYSLIRRGFAEGDSVRRDLADPTVASVMLALRKLSTEEDHLRGFVRFSELDGTLVGEIAPKNRVLPLLGPHFAGRFPNEKIVLYDRTHGEALFCEGGKRVILPVEDFQMGPAGETERAFRTMWRNYFDTAAIRERENPVCQNTHLPKRYRSVMTEFMEDDMVNCLPS